MSFNRTSFKLIAATSFATLLRRARSRGLSIWIALSVLLNVPPLDSVAGARRTLCHLTSTSMTNASRSCYAPKSGITIAQRVVK